MIAKYLATSFAMLNVVSAPRVISNCLPISTTSISLVGLVEIHHVAGLLRRLGAVFMATPTSAWASAGASLVPSPVMATTVPSPCSWRMQGELVLGGGLGDEVVHARLRRRWQPR